MRNGVAGLDSTIAAAKAAGAKLHIVHVNSSGDTNLVAFLARIQAARDAGQDVTTEAYPYGAGMTEIQSALFDDWKTWPDSRFGLHQLVSTGERLTRKTFAEHRAKGGTVIIHGRSEEQTRAAIVSPLTMIASDGFIEHGRGHPRTSGSYAKVLGKYVRDEKALTLMDALRKMTIEPARRLEARVPSMATKGRIPCAARPAANVTACSSAMPTSKARSGCAIANLSTPVPDGIAAVIAQIFGSFSASLASVSQKTFW
jgi:dihydroorotase